MPENNEIYLDTMNVTSWSWEELAEREYANEEDTFDVMYPETYC